MKAYDLAKNFFSEIMQDKEIQANVKRFDQDVQFYFKDDKPFYLEIRAGSIGVKEGESPKDYHEKIDIKTDLATFYRLVNGAVGFAGAIEDMDMECRDMIKRPIIGWFGKTVRMGQNVLILNRGKMK